MKKLFYAFVCILAVTLFAACGGTDPSKLNLDDLDNTTAKCWKTTVTYGGATEEGYLWGTERFIVGVLQEAEKLSSVKYTWKYSEASAKDEESCERLNPDYEEHYCWKVSAYGGMYVSYMWDSEEGIKEYAALIDATYEKADAKDEDSCEKLNDEDPIDPVDPLEQYDNTVEKCWKLTISYMGATQTSYIWGTERMAVANVVNSGLTFTHEVADANDADACNELNNPDNPENPALEGYDNTVEKCWHIAVIYQGTTEEYYTWGTEREAVADLVLGGQTFRHEEANAADEDACDELENNNPAGEEQCWKLTTTSPEGLTIVIYTWESEQTIKQQVAISETQGFKTSYEPAAADDEDSCEAFNNANASCWQITISMMGQSQTEYVWASEDVAKAIVDAAKQKFAESPIQPTINYSKASATDKDACEDLND